MANVPMKRWVWDKGVFMAWGKIYDFPPRDKIYLEPLFASIDVMGSYRSIVSESYRRPCVRCVAIWTAQLEFVGVAFVPRGTAEWLARVHRVRWRLAIGDLARLSCRTLLHRNKFIRRGMLPEWALDDTFLCLLWTSAWRMWWSLGDKF